MLLQAPHISTPSGNAPLLADVIVPLALSGTFTYLVPPALAGEVRQGSRVLVSFGKKKLYTAIVLRLPGTTPPEGVELKPILEVIDADPIVTAAQLELWQWLSAYYMCTIGEVMKAAMPSSLKLESETMIEVCPDATATEPREAEIIKALSGVKAMRLADLVKQFAADRRPIHAPLRRLIDQGLVKVSESLRQREKMPTITYVALTAEGEKETNCKGKNQAALLAHLQKLKASGAPDAERAALVAELPSNGATIAALRKKGLIYTYDRPADVAADDSSTEGELPQLAEAQLRAFHDICDSWQRHNVCLLHGVTSSGKTEIYIRLIARTLAEGKSVLYLLPEIALTTQITSRLSRVFGKRMGLYHSKLSDTARASLWRRQLSPEACQLILGARSALFLPYHNLGLIIVDEEHETSFKQQDPAPRYHARDAAIVLAARSGAKVLLGTATPSVESYHNATTAGKYGLVCLKERYGGATLPDIIVEDVGELRRKKLMKTPFSPRLIDDTRAVLDGGGQAIFFINRRGYTPVMECHTCGWTPRCVACDVPLTHHRQTGRLVCHYCGATYAIPAACPCCGEHDLRGKGQGTEKIEEEVSRCFPQARPARMDLDTTRAKTAHEKIIEAFKHLKTNLLIGTQMVTKGLDFDHVGVVGILDADALLNRPDFRAHERAFQMMSQVAGRAGRRGGSRGHVVLQTKQPSLPVVAQIVGGDYESMFAGQIAERREFLFPPFCRLIVVCLKHRYESACEKAAEAMATLLRPSLGTAVLGPDRPAVGRVQYQHIRRLVVKVISPHTPQGVKALLLHARTQLMESPEGRGVAVFFDVDPI